MEDLLSSLIPAEAGIQCFEFPGHRPRL